MKKCFEIPPQDIYDCLHALEKTGYEIPESVDKWWERETELLSKTEAAEKCPKCGAKLESLPSGEMCNECNYIFWW